MNEINISKEEIAYIAGLLEGEGYFGIQEPYSPTIKLSMTDLDVIEKAKIIFRNNGNILVTKRPEGFKIIYTFNLYGKNALEWMQLIYPLMGLRRKQKINEIIEIYNKRPILGENRTHCRKGHELKPDNYIIDNNNVKQCKICHRERSLKNHNKRNSLVYILAKHRNISLEDARKLIDAQEKIQ